VAGTVVAIVQPGDLGKDDVASGPTATSSTTSTTEAPTTTAGVTTLPSNVSTTIPGSGSTTVTTSPSTTAAPSTTATTIGATTSTTAGSGLGVGGAGTPNPDGSTAQTGGESMLGLGMGLLGLSLVARRAMRRP
jgi:hypothetical protein